MADGASNLPGRFDGLSITDRELFHRIGWFTHLRWAFGLFATFMLLVGWHVLGVRFTEVDGTDTIYPAVSVVLAIFLYNAVFVFVGHIARSRRQIDRRLIVAMATGQIACDLAATLALIHYTGGFDNLFIVLVLLPIAIATELLPQRLAYATAAVAVVCINVLAWAEQQGWISHVQIALVQPSGDRVIGARHADPMYILEITGALTVAIFAMVFVMSTIAARLRSREAQLEEAYRRLHAADENKSFFMRQAGHEMRAPLAAIGGILDSIDATCNSLTAEHRQLLGRGKHRTQSLITLIDELRRYSRLRSGRVAHETRPVCLGELVIETVDLFGRQAAAAGVDLNCDVQPIWVTGDQELLRELVTNLVANAVQYTPAGGRIDVTLGSVDGHAVLRVADTGIGISPRLRERVFEEFYRTGQAKEHFPDGTGLGLAISHRIVQIHEGRIAADCPQTGGTVFTVHLPVGGGGAT